MSLVSFQGGERELTGKAPGGGSYCLACLLVLGNSMDFNRSQVTGKCRAGRGRYADEDYQSAKQRQCVFKIFAFHDRFLKLGSADIPCVATIV